MIGETQFICDVCSHAKPINKDGGVGYGIDRNGLCVCYACCAIRDRYDMLLTGKAILYLVACDTGLPGGGKAWKLHNWPGTLMFNLHRAPRVGNHNIAGKRYDVWFTGPDNKPWHGVQYGDDTQLCHCKRLKETCKAAKGLDA